MGCAGPAGKVRSALAVYKMLKRLERKLNYDPGASVQEIENMLMGRFGMTELPLYTIPLEAYLDDDEVDHRLVAKLYTTVDPEIINQMASNDEVDYFGQQYDEELWESLSAQQKLLGEGVVDIRIPSYTQMRREHETMQRVSVVLQRDPKDPAVAGDFKVYGAGQNLRYAIWVRTGVFGMRRGRLKDPRYELYLDALHFERHI